MAREALDLLSFCRMNDLAQLHRTEIESQGFASHIEKRIGWIGQGKSEFSFGLGRRSQILCGEQIAHGERAVLRRVD